MRAWLREKVRLTSMPGRKQPRGDCGYCESDFSVGGMIRHLSACPARKDVVAEADARRGRNAKLYHLRAQDEWIKGFWLDLEVNGSTILDDVDDYLRRVWLECCGHLSMFSRSGWGSGEISNRRRVADIFDLGTEITHIYDFGDSSYTLLRCIAVREGKPINHPHPIALMSRNHKPDHACISCERRASWLCIECIYEDEVQGTLCQRHAEQHPHDNYGEPMKLVNSPRTGMCGYDGPADPPY